MLLERIGLDLDEAGIKLSGYKVISKVYPQISTPSSNGDFSFSFGAADTPNDNPSYSPASTFNSLQDYKIDTRIAGRYLSYKMTTPSDKDFALSGMDLEVIVTGRR